MQPNSPAFSWNLVDWKRWLVTLETLLAGFAATELIPSLAGFSYQWGGHDYSWLVLIVLTGIADALKRFVVDQTPKLGGFNAPTIPASVHWALGAFVGILVIVALLPWWLSGIAALLVAGLVIRAIVVAQREY